MESVWTTIGTILATGIVIYGGYFLRDFLQGKRETEKQKLEREREIRDARRRYRESVVSPLRAALTELRASLAWRPNLISHIRGLNILLKSDGIKAGAFSLTPKDVEAIKWMEELIRQKEHTRERELKDSEKVTKEFLPLVDAITDEDTRVSVAFALLFGALTTKEKDEHHIEEKDVEEKFDLAYRNLEDYVALAD